MKMLAMIMAAVVAVDAVWVDLFAAPHFGLPLDTVVDVSCAEGEGGLVDCWLVGNKNGSTGVFKVTDVTMQGARSLAVGSVDKPLYIGCIAMQNGWEGVVGGVSLGYGGTYFTITGRVFNTSMNVGSLLDAHAVYSLGNHTYAAVGLNAEFGMGPEISNNAGVTFLPRWWPQGFSSNFYPRFGAFPLPQTWYISGGAYPGMVTNAAGTSETFNFYYGKNKTSEKLASNYSAVIAKTEDGGITWQTQYTSYGLFYFNEISCWNATVCAAIGEGNGTVYIYKTNDGKKWNLVHKSSANSTSTANCLRSQPAGKGWAVISTGIETTFLHTTDNGTTWEVSSIVPAIRSVTGMTLFNTHGYATAITTSGVSTILGLDMAPAPTPNHLPPGYYVQKRCSASDCSSSCTSTRHSIGKCFETGVRNSGNTSYIMTCSGNGTFTVAGYSERKCRGSVSVQQYMTNSCVEVFGNPMDVSCPGDPVAKVNDHQKKKKKKKKVRGV